MKKYLKIWVLLVFVLCGQKNALANDIYNLSVPISPSGDVPQITVPCTIGHAYTEALYNNSLNLMLGSYGLSGGVFRKYCETGTISFDGWNMNTVLDAYNGVDNWTQYIRTPFKYVIVDSTRQGGCSSVSFCGQYNLVGAWDGYRSAIYLPSTTCYNTEYNEQACTLASGPIWTTTPYTRTWADPRDLIPVPPPVGDPHNLPTTISPSGDIATTSISCIPGHDYTLSLVHSVNDVVIHSVGVIQRIYCYPGVHNNVIAFSGFNLNDYLKKRIDPSWWNWVQTPLQYIIKDTTGIYACDDEYCPLTILESPFNNFNKSVYLASEEHFPTVGVGPVFDTQDHTTWFDVRTAQAGFSNVLFIPGFEGSRLYADKTILGIPTEDQLWEPNTNSDAVDLYLRSDGSSQKSGVYTRDIIKETNTPIGTSFLGQNIYKSFSTMMDGLVADGSITAWQSFAYDWRQGVQDIVDNGTQYKIGGTLTNVSLIETLQGLVDSSKNGKVTIVAHSNGGLLAKALLKKLEDDKLAGRNTLIDHIDIVILVASPQWGTPASIPAILHGYDQDINPLYIYSLLTPSTARELGKNMPGAYGLLPSPEYFNHIGTPVINFVPNILDPYMSHEISVYGQSISNYAGQKNFINGTDSRVNPSFIDTLKPILGNSSLLAQAENLHNSIDTLTVPENIKVIQVAGWGLDTLAGFQYNASTTCSYVTDNGCTGSFMLDEKPIFTIDGDKTVVTPSALAMNGEKYFLNLKKYNKDKLSIFPIIHKNILESNPLLNFISDNLKHSTSTDYAYISTTKPIDTSNRIRLSVHSPVTLDAYDTDGNHTGKVCVTSGCYIEENIPNSSYYEFGEGKYINIPEDGVQKVVLKGTDTGTFTLDWQNISPSNSTHIESFVNIPVTTQTDAVVILNQNTETPELSLDNTGDGITDVTLKPGVNREVSIPHPLSVTAVNKKITLGSPLPQFDYTFSGFISGDTAGNSDITGSANCTTTAIQTSPVGNYPITCTVGTLSSQKYYFNVFNAGTLTIEYRFDGFLQPINDTSHQIGQNVSVFKAGSTVPVKFQLKKADGTPIQSAGVPIWLTPQKGSSMNASIDESIYSDAGTSGNMFKWDSVSKQYVYNWSTKGLSSGFWYRLYAKVDDGNVYTVTVGLK